MSQPARAQVKNGRTLARARRKAMSAVGKVAVKRQAKALSTTNMALLDGDASRYVLRGSNALTEGEKCVLNYPNGCGHGGCA